MSRPATVCACSHSKANHLRDEYGLQLGECRAVVEINDETREMTLCSCKRFEKREPRKGARA